MIYINILKDKSKNIMNFLNVEKDNKFRIVDELTNALSKLITIS